MKMFFKFYDALGNNKSQKFFRFLLLIFTIGAITMAIINLGYDETKGGLYWKPFDISIHKTIGGSNE